MEEKEIYKGMSEKDLIEIILNFKNSTKNLLEEVEQLKKDADFWAEQYQSLGKEDFEREKQLKKENEELKELIDFRNTGRVSGKLVAEKVLRFDDLETELEVYKKALEIQTKRANKLNRLLDEYKGIHNYRDNENCEFEYHYNFSINIAREELKGGGK